MMNSFSRKGDFQVNQPLVFGGVYPLLKTNMSSWTITIFTEIRLHSWLFFQLVIGSFSGVNIYIPRLSKGVKFQVPGRFLVVKGLKFQTLGGFRYMNG